MRTFSDFNLAWSEDRREWVLPRVLARRAETHPDKVFVVEGDGGGRSYTFSEVYGSACSVANGLRSRGFAKGDRLSIMLESCAEYVFSWFGANLLGVIEAPINQEYVGSFLEHSVLLIEPRAVVTTPQLVGTFLASVEVLPDNMSFFLVGEAGVAEAIDRLTEIGWKGEPFSALLAEPSTAVDAEISYDTIAALIGTSGTTGPSKAVRVPFAQMHLFAETLINACDYTEDDVADAPLPLFHAGGQFIIVYTCLLAAATVVLFSRFTASDWLARLQRHGITVTYLLGGMMDWVWKQPRRPDDADNDLRCVWAGPIPATIEQEFLDRFGAMTTSTGYGQTEMTFPFATPYKVEGKPPGAVGLLVDRFFEVKLVDPETDEEVAEGEVGELLIRSKHPWLLADGYWGMPEATAHARQNLWFHSGDACRRDAEGWYFFVDRMTDSLRRNGENISSLEVEAVLLQHDAIAECAILAERADDEGGEDEVKAVIVLVGGVTIEELINWSKDRLPYFAVPRYWQVVEALPKTPTGKIQKHLLRGCVGGETFDRTAAGIRVGRRVTAP